MCVALVIAGCQSTGLDGSDASSTEATTPPAADDGIVLVALGDSGTTGHGDPTGRGWVAYYGQLVSEDIGRPVQVENLAVDGTTTADLLRSVQSLDRYRAAIADASIVVIGIGGNELNEGDAAFESGACDGTQCYDEPAQRYRTNLDAIESEVLAIAAAKPLLLRAVGMNNALTGAESVIPDFLRPVATEVGAYTAKIFDQATCEVTEEHGGACASLLIPFNGPDGTEDAYKKGLLTLDPCCYDSQAGEELVAEILYETGLEGLEGE